MPNDVRREQKRLERLFHRALLLALATPIAAPLACSSRGSEGPAGNAGATGAGGTSSAVGSSSSGATTSAGSSASSAAGSGGAATTSAGSGGSTSAAASTGSAGGGSLGDAGSATSCAPFAFTPSPVDTCGNYVRLPCGLPAGITDPADCYLTLADCASFCPGSFFNCHTVNLSCTDAGAVVLDPQGGVDLDCSICANGVGRVPAGLAPARMPAAGSALGAYFAAAAHFEAASVHAFRRLRGELQAHRAPPRLLGAARRAQRDEARHARLMARMARRFGGRPVPPAVAPAPARALAEIALENAVEGCVRETFGALVASFQAASAADPEIAALMAAIARDETRHAALSWAVARWAAPRLEGDVRARLAARCREAVAALRRDVEVCWGTEVHDRAGLPAVSQRRALLAAMEETLWQSPLAAAGDR